MSVSTLTPRQDGRAPLGELAPYAADASRAGPRRVAEPEPVGRTAFQRDRDRLIHSVAFRRLAHKTQVLTPEYGEQHRTRLTHTLEVAQIARSLARALRLDEDLAEALALAHDLGHGPFGHTGEAALDRVLAPYGGFDHNVQSLRVVVELERRYLDFDGLNLTWTTLEGLAKRKGPWADPPRSLRGYDAGLDLRLDLYPSAEAQVAAVADDIAYNAHDLEDGLLAGLFNLEEAATVPLVDEVLAQVRHGRGTLPEDRLPFALARGLVDAFVTDARAETARRLVAAAPADVEAVRALGEPMAGLSPALAEAEQSVKAFLFARMYRNPRLLEARAKAHELVGRLAEALLAAPDRMPSPWAVQASGRDQAGVARLVGDYVAGLSDREAEREHGRLFDASADFV